MTPHSPQSDSLHGRGLDYVVLASAKSGTTWIQRLLSAHPEVHCSESRLFGRYFDKDNPSGPNLTVESYVENLARHFNPPVPSADANHFYQSLLHNIIAAIAGTSRDASGKPLYGEKFTPYPGTAIHAAQMLQQHNPSLKLIHLVRDGRDVVVSGSVQRANLQLRIAAGDRAASLRHALESRRVLDEHLDFFTDLWIDSVSAGIGLTLAMPHSITIRYEQMLDSPLRTAELLFTYIGADPAAATHCLHAASFERLSGGRNPGEEDLSSFFRRGVAGDWRNWLTPDQVAVFESRAGSLLDQLGYPRAATACATT